MTRPPPSRPARARNGATRIGCIIEYNTLAAGELRVAHKPYTPIVNSRQPEMNADGVNPKTLRDTDPFCQPAWRPLNLSPRLWL